MAFFSPGQRRVAAAFGLLVTVVSPAFGQTDSRPAEPAPAYLKRPAWGKVEGWVLDAATRQPVPGARIQIAVDGVFPEAGKSTDQTEADGRFEARVPLGKVSSKFDWGRLLVMHPVSLLLSPKSVTKQTKIVDVAQVNVRAEADGYKPFVGQVRATIIDPGSFSITLDDLWLAPEQQPLVSFSPGKIRAEVIESLRVEPAVAAPGDKVKITLIARLPVDRKQKYEARLTSTASRLVDNQLELKRDKEAVTADDPRRVVFAREVTLPKSGVDRWTEIGFFLVRNGATMLRARERRVLLQVVKTPEERAAAELVSNGYGFEQLGDREAALREYSEARAKNADYPPAHLFYGDLCLQVNRPHDALAAYKRLVDLDPRDYELARPRYARALLDTGKPAEAVEQLADTEKATGKKRVAPEVFLYRARGFASQGNFEEADKWLAKAGADMDIPSSVTMGINLRRMQAAVEKDPKNADLRLSYARLLEGAARREEAIGQIRTAAGLDPAQPWAYLDLGQALWDLGRHDEALANLKHALALAPENAEVQLAVADAHRESRRYADALPLYERVTKKQPQNTRARHFHALMLYATGSVDAALPELEEVLAQARDKGDLREKGFVVPGLAIYLGPKRRLVAGFSAPEATAGLSLMEALQHLKTRPDDALLHQNAGSALLDLGLADLALEELRKSHRQDATLLETRFLMGMAYRRLEQPEQARAELQAVIDANPLHPRARVELAQLFTETGDLEQAQAQLLAHSKNYPAEPTRRPTESLGG